MRITARRPAALGAVRGSLLAVSSAVLSVMAHHLADGGLPDPALTMLLAGLVGWTATALARKARGPLATIALLGSAQVIMHLVLTTLSRHDMSGPGNYSGLAMFTAHAIATLLTALLLARADAMLLTVLAVLRAILPRLLAPLPVPAAAPVRLPAPAWAPGHLIGIDLRRAYGRRGPPSGS
jgi:hypothetical protein